MTSAPRSARIIEQNGPAIVVASSSTRSPEYVCAAAAIVSPRVSARNSPAGEHDPLERHDLDVVLIEHVVVDAERSVLRVTTRLGPGDLGTHANRVTRPYRRGRAE